ncbi:hypothetical protein FLL45_15765 [Aliikangiella marina]|uniref:Uncharacterized protein n=1 Tax=Aliikangiella marina TaxID=1712262 RepID=A0A545T6S2_9GAMM|nr:hypothetical protein [Aliikangiella marina]TQV72921.1 hypothetical protein FLL45_15765 [Aliikangiella marina]
MYKLTPSNGWKGFSKSKEIGDVVYTSFMPYVNDGVCYYLNLTNNTAMFEDDMGNTLSLEFNDKGEDLHSLSISISKTSSERMSLLESTINKLESDYNLIRN